MTEEVIVDVYSGGFDESPLFFGKDREKILDST